MSIISDIAKGITGTIGGVLGGTAQLAGGVVNGTIQIVGGTINNTTQAIGSIVQRTADFIGNVAQGISEFTTIAIQGVSDIVYGTLENLSLLYRNSLNDLVDGGIEIAGGVTNLLQGIISPTIYNDITSYLRNFYNASISGVTNYNPNFLKENTPIAPPIHQDLNATPTVSDFLQAATSVYTFKGSVDGAKPFDYYGQQLGIVNSSTGAAAKVWISSGNQVIIAYQGTGGGETGHPITSVLQTLQDLGILARTVTPGEKDSLKFAQFVVNEAQKRGYSSNDIFVTGHSLGAIEAEYVAQQTGLAGVVFDSTGIPPSNTEGRTGENFINILYYGDPVSSFASDVEGEQPFAPPYDPTGGVLPHYGNNFFIGNIEDQEWLSAISQQWDDGLLFKKLAAASEYLINGLGKFHLPDSLAKALGVDLTKNGGINGRVDIPAPEAISGNVGTPTNYEPLYSAALNVGDKTIQQLLDFNSQRTDYHYSSLPTYGYIGLAA